MMLDRSKKYQQQLFGFSYELDTYLFSLYYSVKNVVVVITDGRTNEGASFLSHYAQSLKNQAR